MMQSVQDLKLLRLQAERHVDLENVFKRKKIYDRIASLFPTQRGKNLSAKEREVMGQHSTTLVYGEIKFEPFAIAIEKIKKKYGGLPSVGEGVYYDIGSGTGKPVFAAVLMHPFKRAVGIEILESLHNAALETAKHWRETIINSPKSEDNNVNFDKTIIEFIHGDIRKKTDIDISDGTLLFSNSTCFDDQLMLALVAINYESILLIKHMRLFLHGSLDFQLDLILYGQFVYIKANAADHCAIGTFFITFTKEIPSRKWMVNLEMNLRDINRIEILLALFNYIGI